MATPVQPSLTISESYTCVALELSREKYNLFVTLDMLPITKDCAVPEKSGVYVEASSILLPTDQPMKTGLCSRVIKFTPIAAVCASKLQVRGVIGQPIK